MLVFDNAVFDLFVSAPADGLGGGDGGAPAYSQRLPAREGGGGREKRRTRRLRERGQDVHIPRRAYLRGALPLQGTGRMLLSSPSLIVILQPYDTVMLMQ
eukprot:7884630-Pyramimonas_sp.AAC.1